MIELMLSLDTTSHDEIIRLVKATHELDNVCGYKIGALCSLSLGMASVVAIIRSYTAKQIIYDHQKAGNDIPDITRRLVALAADSGVTGFILFPFAGPQTLRAGIDEGRNRGLTMIVGAHMTHPSFSSDKGGFISLSGITRIFETAVDLGVKDFVLPGNQVDLAAKYADELTERVESPTFWAPGFGRQGGAIQEFANGLGGAGRLVAIVGSSIYEAENPAAEIKRICRV
jgi:orotidine-5'-phosphate decarboxylase